MQKHKDFQKSLFDQDLWLPQKTMNRLEKSWAGVFREHILPHLVETEKDFAPLYSAGLGAPGKPVANMLGILILKEMFDLTDKEALSHFEFDLQWHYALDLSFDEAYLCEKTLFNFRNRIMEDDRACQLYKDLTDRLIARWNLSTRIHRMDSTVFRSNMKTLTRLQLFVRTIEVFLKKLKKKYPNLYKKVPAPIVKRYMDREGYFSDPQPSLIKRRLRESAEDLCELINLFRKSDVCTRLQSYINMRRLMEEQVMVMEYEDGEVRVLYRDPNNEDGGEVLKDPKSIGGGTLQNPSDPDASFSGQKGPGYKAQIAETCDENNPFQVVDYMEIEKAHESDQNATVTAHQELIERGHEPEKTFVDAGYVSGENIVETGELGVDLQGPLPGRQIEETEESEFVYDDNYREVKSCPRGCIPERNEYDEKRDEVRAYFKIEGCAGCPHEKKCPARKVGAYRVFKIKRFHAATVSRRKEQKTREFKEAYKKRSAVEGTISQFKNTLGMSRMNVRGSPPVRLRGFFKAIGINIWRLINYVQETAEKCQKALCGAAA